MQITYNARDIDSEEFFEHTQRVNLNYHLHAHYSMELVLVTQGTLAVTIGEEICTIHENQALLVPSFVPHGFQTPEGEGSSAEILMFSPELVRDFYLFLCSHDCLRHSFSTATEDRRMLLRFSPCGTVYEKKSLLYGFISLFMENNEFVPKRMNYSEQTFHRILSYLMENAQWHIDLEHISARFGIHPVTVCKLFRKNLYSTFGEVLSNIRVSHARALLKNSKRTVSEIGYECGFGSLRNFNRVFLKHIGCTPREYREKN